MRKRLLFALLSLFYALVVSAIDYRIEGTVVDDNGEPLPSASVLLFKGNEEKQYKGDATDIDGKFAIKELTEGQYRLEISFMGFKKKTINVSLTPTTPIRRLKKITIQEDASLLSAVEVTAKRSSLQVDIDKKTFIVNESAVSDGMSASEVLKEIPSVAVDVEGNVSMRNNENVEIYINGRPSGMTEDNKADLLEQLPAGSIERVEVITNPSSKFSAEGSAGIINIVMKQSVLRTAYYGTLSAGLTYPWGGRLGGNASANINFNKNKWSTGVSIGYRNRKNDGGGESRREYYEEDTTLINQYNDTEFEMNSAFVRLTASCQADSNNVFGFAGMFMFGDRFRGQFIDYEHGYINGGNRIFNSFQNRDSRTDNDRLMGYGEVNYTHNFSESHTLAAVIDFSANKNDNERNYYQRNFDSLHVSSPVNDYDQNQATLNKNRTWEAQLDYVNPISSTSKLEAGAKVSLDHQYSNVTTEKKMNGSNDFIPQAELDNDFEMQQNVYSIYASYGSKFRRFAAQLGLRGELTDVDWTLHTNGDKSTKKPYANVFPTVFLSYIASDNDELQLSYTRRISRPKSRRLNPYKDVEDSTNISFGNPDLDPEFTNSFEFSYVKNFCEKKHSFISSVYYQLRQDIIQKYSWRSEDVLMNTYENMSTSHSTGLELILKNHWKYVDLSSNVNFYYYKLTGGDFTVHNAESASDIDIHVDDRHSWSWTAKISSTFILPKNISMELTGNYRSPKATAQGKTLNTYFVNFGAKKSFFDKKLNLTLSVRDILNSRKRKSETWDDDFYQYSETTWNGRSINLNVSYTFGNMKKKAKKGKSDSFSSDDDGGMDDF